LQWLGSLWEDYQKLITGDYRLPTLKEIMEGLIAAFIQYISEKNE